MIVVPARRGPDEPAPGAGYLARMSSRPAIWLSLALLAAALAAGPVVAQEPDPTADPVVVVVPAELNWREAPTGARFAGVFGDPGRPGPFAFRMRLPARFTIPAHTHNATEHVTVVSGTLYMSLAEGEEPRALPAGSYVAVPAGQPMWIWTRDAETEIQIHGEGPFETERVGVGDGGEDR